jgi:hypothetical protein
MNVEKSGAIAYIPSSQYTRKSIDCTIRHGDDCDAW